MSVIRCECCGRYVDSDFEEYAYLEEEEREICLSCYDEKNLEE